MAAEDDQIGLELTIRSTAAGDGAEVTGAGIAKVKAETSGLADM